MFTSLTETNPALEYQNPASRSFVFNDFSLDDSGYFVCGILAVVAVILVKARLDSIQQISSALQKYASILGEIDKVGTIFGGSSDEIEPHNSQLLTWYSPLSDKNGLGSCYADRDTDTLSNDRARDRLFANKAGDVIEVVERAEGDWPKWNYH
jgi:hypothetical protein